MRKRMIINVYALIGLIYQEFNINLEDFYSKRVSNEIIFPSLLFSYVIELVVSSVPLALEASLVRK